MLRKLESGKLTLLKGSMNYAWEELKTLNTKKVQALATIMKGYFKMKFKDKKMNEQKKSSYDTSDDYLSW